MRRHEEAHQVRQPWRSTSSTVMTPRRRRMIPLLLVIVLDAAGCTRWRVQSVAPEEVVSTKRPLKARFTLPDRSRVVLQQPTIVRDTIYGTPDRHGIRQSVALVDVREVAVRRWNPLGPPCSRCARRRWRAWSTSVSSGPSTIPDWPTATSDSAPAAPRVPSSPG